MELSIKDIAIFREAIKRVTSILAGRDITVTEKGKKAYVRYHKNEPVEICIPSIPDTASLKYIQAIRGFVDHEVAHVLFTDHKYIFSTVGERFSGLWMFNAVEDVFIERKMSELFAGSNSNLISTRQHIIETVFEPQVSGLVASTKDEIERFHKFFLSPILRAWAGQRDFEEFMAKYGDSVSDIRQFMENKGIDKAIRAITCSKESLAVSARLIAAMKEYRKLITPPPPLEEPEKPEPEEPKPEETEPEEPEPEESEPEKPEPEEPEPEKPESKPEEPEPDESDECESEEPEPDDSESEGPEPDDFEEEEGSKPEPEESAVGEEPEDDEPDSDEDDDGDPEDGEPEDDDPEVEEPDLSMLTDGESLETLSTEEALKELLSSEEGAISRSAYRPFDRSYDFMGDIEKSYEFFEKTNRDIVDKGRDSTSLEIHAPNYKFDITNTRVFDVVVAPKLSEGTVAVMSKELERIIASKDKTMYIPGQKRGRVHGPSLYRLGLKDDRVFRTKETKVAVNACVQIVVDLSGSMSGLRIEVAMAAAYSLGQVLDTIKVPCIITGFTTAHGPAVSHSDVAEGYRSGAFNRFESLYLPTIKGWSRRTDSIQSRAAMGFCAQQLELSNNVDGESILALARHFDGRKEDRRLMIVLSDGAPLASGKGFGEHLKDTVKVLEQSGIEMYGVGIQTDAPKKFYKNNVCLDRVSDLPQTLVGLISKSFLAP